MTQNGLLETLSSNCSCDYLSDLGRCGREIILRELEKIPADKYPVKEWNDAIEYLCHYEIPFPTSEEARAYLRKQYLDAGDPA